MLINPLQERPGGATGFSVMGLLTGASDLTDSAYSLSIITKGTQLDNLFYYTGLPSHHLSMVALGFAVKFLSLQENRAVFYTAAN